MTLSDIIDRMHDLEAEILASCTAHPAESAGLDNRCGTILLSEEFLDTQNRRSLDYYGGFGYVDPEHVFTVGDLTLYAIDSDRVATAIQNLEYNHD